MRSIGIVGSLAALLVSAPLAAQSNKFRTDVLDPAAGRQVPTTSRDQQQQTGQVRRSDKIPPGQMPPAGMCRIWIDGVPPGRQPAPTDCQTAVATKPANARVIWGDQAAFPGKGKSKANKGDDDNRVKNQSKGRDDDDDQNERTARINPRTGSVIGSAPVSAQSKAKANKKGKGRGGK